MEAWVYNRNVDGHIGDIELVRESSRTQGDVQIWDGDRLVAIIYQDDMDKLAKRWLAMREKARKSKRRAAKP